MEGPRKAGGGAVRPGRLMEKTRSEPCRPQPPDRPDLGGILVGRGGRDGVCFLFQGKCWPTGVSSYGDVLDSCFLNPSKNHCCSSSRCAFSCALSQEKDKGWCPGGNPPLPSHCPREAGGEPETGAWAGGLNAGITGHPRHWVSLPSGPRPGLPGLLAGK